jgi:methyl-accepting chemotaxis protein
MESAKIYEKILRIRILAANSRGELFQAMQHNPASPYKDMHNHPVTDHVDAVTRNREEVTAIIDDIMNSNLTPQQEAQMANFMMDRDKFVNEGLNPACAAIQAGDYQKANEILLSKAWPLSMFAISEAESFDKLGSGEKVFYTVIVAVISVVIAASLFVGAQLLASWLGWWR